MKKIFTILLIVGNMTNAYCQKSEAEKHDPNMKVKTPDEKGLVWYQPYEAPMTLLGFKWFEENNRKYYRLPEAMNDKFRKPVVSLAGNTAGGQIRFKTDSRRIVVQAELPRVANMDHMARTGQNGFDLYIGPAGRQRFVGQARIRNKILTQELLRASTKEMRNVTINFPLYNGVKSVKIGVEAGAKVESPEPLVNDGCVVVYGTSITQGGCASRPGTAYTNILSRLLNMEFVNLGFSGNGRGEPELALAITQIPKKRLIILDYEANAGGSIKKNIEPFIKILRDANKAVPILVVSKIRYAKELVNPNMTKSRRSNLEFMKSLVDRLTKAGDKNIYFMNGEDLLGENWDECTVDGVHPTDLGFMQMATALSPVISKILNIPTKNSKK
jgi:lysophospholipase L1-like esterase